MSKQTSVSSQNKAALPVPHRALAARSFGDRDRRRRWGPTLILAAVSVAGCAASHDSPSEPVAQTEQAGRCLTCNASYNGSGVLVQSALPYSQFGLQDPIAPWYVAGFRNQGGSVVVTGWRGVYPMESQVVSAEWEGRSYQLAELTVNRTQLQVKLSGGFTTQTVAGKDFGDGLILNIRVQDPIIPGLYSTRQLRIRGESGFDTKRYPNADGVTGYTVEYQRVIPGLWDNHCGTLMAKEKSIFLGGSLWNPVDASRTDDEALVALSCEGGAVGRCAMWGYPPYKKGDSRYDAIARDYHQSCVYLKRAAYCAGDKTNDADEMPIQMSDQFSINQIDPLFDNVDHLEAVWGPSGALCVTQQPIHRRNRFNNFLPSSPIRCLDLVSGLRTLPDCTPLLIQQNPTAIRSKYLDPIDKRILQASNAGQAVGTVYGNMNSAFDELTGAFTPAVSNYGSDGTYQTAAVNP